IYLIRLHSLYFYYFFYFLFSWQIPSTSTEIPALQTWSWIGSASPQMLGLPSAPLFLLLYPLRSIQAAGPSQPWRWSSRQPSHVLILHRQRPPCSLLFFLGFGQRKYRGYMYPSIHRHLSPIQTEL